MLKKISVWQFRKIRKKLDTYYNNQDRTKFYNLQEKLFSYDLNKIPYKEWKGFKLCFLNNSSDFICYELYKKYPMVFRYLMHANNIDVFDMYIDKKKDLSEDSFINGMKKYILYNEIISTYKFHYGKNFIPEWVKSLGFNCINELTNVEDLMKCDKKTLILNNNQQEFIESLGIENLKRLEQETKIFSRNGSYIFYSIFPTSLKLSFINSSTSDELSYEEFKTVFANFLDKLRSNKVFLVVNYDDITGKFREEHSEIFMDKSAPEDLKKAFYAGEINLSYLNKHEEYIPYLFNKKLTELKDISIGLVLDNYHTEVFVEEYKKQYGKEKLLKLFARYGPAISGAIIECTTEEFNDEERLEKRIMRAVKENIIKSSIDYRYLKENKLFYNAYPELFVDFKGIYGISTELASIFEKEYYTRKFNYEYIKKYPQLINVLKNKNLEIPFAGHNTEKRIIIDSTELSLKDMYGNEKFLELCAEYGQCMYNIMEYFKKEIYIKGSYFYGVKDAKYKSYEEVKSIIENIIAKLCISGKKDYYEDAPEFLKQKHPELFLSEDAPEQLKKCFYASEDYNRRIMSFDCLISNKNWLPYLKGKSVSQAFIITSLNPHLIRQYFDLFGEYKGLILGMKKTDTVNKMITEEKVYLMKKWYDKTGGKFIPDYLIMKNFKIDEADKFLSNATNWNKLIKLEDFTRDIEVKDSLLKLAYSFGVFDNDDRGFNKLYELLTRIPKTATSDEAKILLSFDEDLLNKINYKKFKYYSYNIDEITKYINGFLLINSVDKIDYIDFFKAIKKDKLDIDFSKNIILQIYKQNDDGTLTLKINQQKYPNVIKFIRNYLAKQNCDSRILMPLEIHQLFGGFKLEYNPQFREFLLDNLDEILSNNDYRTYIASIQKQFKDIKIVNSNRKLTLDLAMSYVQQNKYEDVEDGNEKVAEISAIAGYDQEDFDILQEIYNYGKQRVFSSIPRIENKTDMYTYEILRLDDPLAMAIGTLTDCCQEIGNVAESCMEHSMVDKNGRIFVIRDKEGNIVSQSWMWRNKDVICFDNIEIPNKAFERVGNRKEFSKEILKIYKKAAEELIKKDEEVYKKLKDEGKITQDQYDGLVLSKVTVGIGYNDIANAIENNIPIDKQVSQPLPFESPVIDDGTLYTSDSSTQYILKEKVKKGKYDVDNLFIHNDLYKIYDNNNFTGKDLFMLGKLEMINEQYSDILDIDKEKNLVSEIADLYGLDKEKTKVIMSTNFAIIYEEKENEITIGDIFYNSIAGEMYIEDVVAMQIRLAIDQIKGNKEIDIDNLDRDKIEMYNKAMNLNKELDIEKGIQSKKRLK